MEVYDGDEDYCSVDGNCPVELMMCLESARQHRSTGGDRYCSASMEETILCSPGVNMAQVC